MADFDWPKAVLLIVVVGVVLGGLGLAVNGRLQIGGVVADTNTVYYNHCGLGNELDAQGDGAFTRPKDAPPGRGEVFSSTRAWTAWFSDGESRPVTIQGALIICGFAGIHRMENSWYRFLYTDDGNSWVGFTQDRIPSGSYQAGALGGGDLGFGEREYLKAYEIIIDGSEFKPCDFAGKLTCTPSNVVRDIKDGAALRVQVFIQRWAGGNAFLVAEDEIELRSALARAKWERGAYTVGEKACATWEIPTTTYDNTGNGSSPAYFLTVLDMNTVLPVEGWDRRALTTTTGRACVDVTQSMFSNDLQTCQNRLRVELLSPIIVADLFDTAVQPATPPEETDLGVGAAPTVTSITFDKPEYQEGDTVVVRWTTSGNVSRVHVLIHINGFKLLDDDFNGTVRKASTVASRAGIVTGQVTAYNYCTPSTVKTVYATVSNAFPGLCELFPDVADCADRFGLGLLWAALAVLAVLIVFGVALWVGSTLKLPPFLMFVAALVVAALVAIALVGIGAFDGLMGVAGLALGSARNRLQTSNLGG